MKPQLNYFLVRIECDPIIVSAVDEVTGFVCLFVLDPPEAPQNLRCQTNLTLPETLSCTWDPGRDPLLPTSYTLHTENRCNIFIS